MHWCDFHAARGESERCILLWCLAARTVAARHLSNCWRLLLSSASRVRKSTELLRHKTVASHQTWPPNRPDLSSVEYRLLRVIQECVCQKQQGTSNIVDELLLLTEWYFISRMTYYISQGRVETPITRGGQLCCSSVANLLQYLHAKNYQNTMRFDSYCKNRRVQFFCPTVYKSHLWLRLADPPLSLILS